MRALMAMNQAQQGIRVSRQPPPPPPPPMESIPGVLNPPPPPRMPPPISSLSFKVLIYRYCFSSSNVEHVGNPTVFHLRF